MCKIFFKIVLIILILSLSVQAQSVQDKKVTNRVIEIADNFIKLHPDTIAYTEEAKSYRWNYEQGLMQYAFYNAWKLTNNKKYFQYFKKNVDYYIDSNGGILTYKKDEFNIDQIAPGRSLLYLFEITKEAKYKKAADLLREQLSQHPRVNAGGFWHKKIYPNQMWLDGLYMGQPFYSMYSVHFNDMKSFDDIALQFRLIRKNLYDNKSGLYFHGWDESKEQKWADKVTGKSPNFWSRSIGWYIMALVDVLDYFPNEHKGRAELIQILKELSASLIKVRDIKTKLWYQVTDKVGKKGNYPEASGSNMFIYAFAKGYNNGFLGKEFLKYAEESYENVFKILTNYNDNGDLCLNNVCRVAGLGGNPYRDGSYEYYISEQKRTNDFKGYGPFLLAAIELEKAKNKNIKKYNVALDNYYNNEEKEGKKYHYLWEDDAFSGFSELGEIFKNNNFEISTLQEEPSLLKLSKTNIYLIVDPDTPKETKNPNYLTANAIIEIAKWVKQGGVLVLMANDSGNCEFTNLNHLARKFGFEFRENSENRVSGKNFDMGKFDNMPVNLVFKGVNKIYMKEISTIKLNKKAEILLYKNNEPVIINSSYGKGSVIAVGDPWLYNEYIDNRKLPVDFENYKAAENFVKYLRSLINK